VANATLDSEQVAALREQLPDYMVPRTCCNCRRCR
jgi:hypothetical protein